SAVAAEDLHHPVLTGELHFLEALALDLLLGVQEPFVVQLRELPLELQVLLVQALQLRVSIDDGEDELLVPSLHSETPFDGWKRCATRMWRVTEKAWQVPRNTAVWLLVQQAHLVNEARREKRRRGRARALRQLRLGRPDVPGRERDEIVAAGIAREPPRRETRERARARRMRVGREQIDPRAEDLAKDAAVRLDGIADDAARRRQDFRQGPGAHG